MDSAIKSKLQTLLRLGLVSQTNVRRAMTLFSDPERYSRSPAYRTLMQEILVDVVDTILKNRVLYAALRSSLTKSKGMSDASETVAATTQKIGESVESDRTNAILRSGLIDKSQITAARKALKSKSNMKQMSMGKVYREMMINLLDSMVKKITGTPALFNAFKYTMGKEVVEEGFDYACEDSIALVDLHEDAQEILEANKPTNPSLWSKAKSMARSKFDVYPSAYANGWAVKWYNSKGGGWKSVSEGKTFFQFVNNIQEALTPARQAVIDRERKKASETMNRASTPTPERNKAYARGSRVNYLELKGLAKKSDKQGSDYQVNKREHAKWRKTEKSMKEETQQLDEVSPPDMEHMTGSKHAKASFTKQYGKRGKSVMYATAWKLHNKNKKKREVKEEAEQIDEAEWGGGFETSREAWSKVQAGLKADNKKRKQMILTSMQKVIDGQMSKIAFKKTTGMSFSEMMGLPSYTKKLKMKKQGMAEGVEQIDELSKKTLASYVQGAHRSQGTHEWESGNKAAKGEYHQNKKYIKREIGIGRALNRLQKD